MRIISSGASTCSTSRTNTCSAESASATPVTAIARIDPHGNREQQTFEADRLAEREEHDEHDEIADELQRERRRDRRVDDDLVRKRDLADQPA